MNFHEFRHVAKISNQGHLGAFTAKRETDGIDSIMRNGESVHFDITDHKALASVNGFNTDDAFAESFGEAPAQRSESGLGNIQRSFPERQHLRQTIAVLSMFVSDKDAVKVIDGHFDGGKPCQSFALT